MSSLNPLNASNKNNSSPTGRMDELDAFLTQIESKFRQPYSSLELTKSVTSNTASSSALSTGHTTSSLTSSITGGGTPYTPGEIVQNLDRCFPRMTQTIRLRCLIGLMGFEPNVARLYQDDTFDRALEDFIRRVALEEVTGQTMEQQDPWIPVMAGIIQGKMFCGNTSSGNDRETVEDSAVDACLYRTKKTDAILKKSVEGILQSIMQASNDAANFREEAEVALTKGDTASEKDESSMEKLLDSFHIGTDMNPHYVPWCYRLCPEEVVRQALPELDDRCDFIVNENADILKVDERVDRIKAQEEKKEQEEKEKMKALADDRRRKMNAASAGSGVSHGIPRNTSVTSAMPSSKTNGISDGRSIGSNSTAELFMRSKTKPGMPSHPSSSQSASSRLASNTLAGRGRPRMPGLGRGAAADAVGGKSLANPMARMARPMAGRGVTRMMNDGRLGTMSSSVKGVASSSGVASAGRAAALHRNRTKMKMIDVSEVEGLKKEEEERNKRLSIEEVQENKRRKIMDKALAKGFKAKLNSGHNGDAPNNGNVDIKEGPLDSNAVMMQQQPSMTKQDDHTNN